MDQNSDNLEHGKQLGVFTCAVVLLTMNTCVLILVSLLIESVIFLLLRRRLRYGNLQLLGSAQMPRFVLLFALGRSKGTCRFAASRTHPQAGDKAQGSATTKTINNHQQI